MSSNKPSDGPYKRQYERFRQRLEVRWEGETGKRASWITEIGMGGCYIETPGHVEMGEIVLLEIRLHTGQWLQISGEVRHAHRGIGFGLKFVSVSDAARDAIKSLIDYINTQKTGMSMVERMARLSQDINFAIIKCHSLQGGLYRSAEAMVQHLDAAFAGVWTANMAGLQLELQTSTGTYKNIEGLFTRIPVGTTRIGIIAKDRQPFISNFVAGDGDICDPEWARREELVAFAGYPLVIDERLVGVMAVFARDQLTDTIIEAMAAVSHTISQWIDRKRLEENIKWVTAHNESILTATNEGVCGIDINGKITFINPIGARLLGWNEKQLIGQSLHDVSHHSHAEGTPYLWSECPTHQSFKGETIHKIENEIFWKKDGTNFPVEYTSAPIKDSEKVIGAVISFKDLTAIKLMEQKEKEIEAKYEKRFKALEANLNKAEDRYRSLEEQLIKNEKDYEKRYKTLEESLLKDDARYDEIMEGVRSFAVPSIKLTIDLMDKIGPEYVGEINRLLRLWSFMVKTLPETQKLSTTKYILINPPKEVSNEPDMVLRLWIDAHGENNKPLLESIVLDETLEDEQRKRVWLQVDRISHELGTDFFMHVMPKIFEMRNQSATIKAIFDSEDIITSLFLSNGGTDALGELLLKTYKATTSVDFKNRLTEWMERAGTNSALESLEKNDQLKHVKV
jgi:PAS domain S-box-containing protein